MSVAPMPSENAVKGPNVTNRSGLVDNSKRVPNKAVKAHLVALISAGAIVLLVD
jgi:hypothetical protein